MHGNGCIIVLARKLKSKLAIRDEGQLLTFCVMHRIKMLKALNLSLHFIRQFSHIHRLYIDDAAFFGCRVKCFGHILPFPDADRLNNFFRARACQIHVQQPVFHNGLADIHAIGEHEAALKLA